MKAAIHYKLKVRLIRKSDNDKIDFIEDEKLFKNESPIKAREEAFKSYQSYLDVLLQSIGKKYQDHNTSKKLIETFVDDGSLTTGMIFEGSNYEISASYGNGIGVYLVIDQPIKDDVFEDKIGEEWCIHGIGQANSMNDPQTLMDGLTHEYLYYQRFGYNTGSRKINVDFLELEVNEMHQETILKTPFDWDSLITTPYVDEEANLNDQSESSIYIEDVIASGETNQVEFKPTLVYNFKTGKGSIAVKSVIAKAICALLNSNGGYLLIGLNDDGKTIGLESDFSLAGEKEKRDFFRLEFDQMLQYFLSFSVKDKVNGDFFEVDSKEIFVVTVFPSKRRPIFMKGREGKEFYVRGEASSRLVRDIEELVNYCIDRFSNPEY